MKNKRKMVMIAFLILSGISIFVIGYSLYVILGLRLTQKLIQVYIHEVAFNEASSRIEFNVTFSNPSSFHVAIKYMRVSCYWSNSSSNSSSLHFVGSREIGFSSNFPEIPCGGERSLIISISASNLTMYKDGVWRLKIFAYLLTNFEQELTIDRLISYGE